MIETRPVIVYDGECRFCLWSVGRIRRFDRNGRFEYLPCQTAGIEERFPILSSSDFNTGLRLIHAGGQVDVGADAVYQIYRQLPPWNLFTGVYRIPGLKQLFRAGYGLIARNRHRFGRVECADEVCEIPVWRAAQGGLGLIAYDRFNATSYFSSPTTGAALPNATAIASSTRPALTRLPARARSFEQAFCTSPSCAVSRACILTGYHSHTHGQYGHCHGIHGFSTHPHITSTLSSLKEHGYATACIGKKHVEPPSVYPFDFEPEVNARNGVELARAAHDFWAAHPDQPFYMHVGFTDPQPRRSGFWQ